MKRAKNIQDTIKEETQEIYPAKYQNFYEATDLRWCGIATKINQLTMKLAHNAE